MVGIGLLYRYGYFKQDISLAGEQLAEYTPQKFSQLPLFPVRDEHNNWITINIALTGRRFIFNGGNCQERREWPKNKNIRTFSHR